VWDQRGRIAQSLSAASLRSSLEASLRRLRVDALDLYQLHWPVPDGEIEEGWATLCELRDAGAVRHAGVSNFSVAQIERCRAIGGVDCCQPPFSLLRSGAARDVLPNCARHGTAVIVYSPQRSGVLAGSVTRETVAALPPDDDRRDDPAFGEPMLSRGVAMHARLRAAGAAAGLEPGALAIAWTLLQPAVSGAIVGFDDPSQVNAATAAARRLDDHRAALAAAGLLGGAGAHPAGGTSPPSSAARSAV